MKKHKRLLVSMIMVGALILSGCAGAAMHLKSAPIPNDKTADDVKAFTGKIIEVAPVLLKHPPRYAFCRIQVVSDSGGKSGFFVPRATTITDLNGKDISGKWPGKGERVDIKYYTLRPGVDDRTYTVSIRYVPLDYVQQPAVSIMPGKTALSASTQTPGLSSQLGDKIPVDKAVVYIYRPTGPMFGADVKIPFDVKANGEPVTTLVQGGYCAYITEPGQIEFTAFDTGFMAPTSVFSVTVDAKAGLAYYLKGAHGKGIAGRAHLEPVSSEAGANEIANCKVITTQ